MKTQYQIIGLSGYAGCGKDTVRAMLEELGYFGLAFADPIRDMLRELLTRNGISDHYINERAFKEEVIPELGVSYRQMAQTLGTEWGRSLHGDFWLRLAGSYMADIEESTGHKHFVVSDVRFVNEAQWVRDRGGVIWRIERPGTVPVRAHVSEQELYHFAADQVIYNVGSLESLHEAVAMAITEAA